MSPPTAPLALPVPPPSSLDRIALKSFHFNGDLERISTTTAKEIITKHGGKVVDILEKGVNY